jgi:hypothetical protein
MWDNQIRVVATTVATGVVTYFVLTVIGAFISANVRRYAAATGTDAYLERFMGYPRVALAFKWVRLNGDWRRIRRVWWLWLILGLSVGTAVTLWTVWMLPSGPENLMNENASLRTDVANLKVSLKTTVQQLDDALKHAGLSLPPTVDVPQTPLEIRTKITAWKNVDVTMKDLASLLDRGDEMLNTWFEDAQKDQSGEAARANDFAKAFRNVRLELENLHNRMAGKYPDIANPLKEAVRPPGRPPVPGTIFDQMAVTTVNFADELSTSANTPDDLRDRVGSPADLLRNDLHEIRNWVHGILQTSKTNREALARAL